MLETIEKFRDAGIQVWMLTGDKIETAKCIAIATGMSQKTGKTHEIRGDQAKDHHEGWIREKIAEYSRANKQTTLLMIDGSALGQILNHKDEKIIEEFFSVAEDAKSVCVCRCNPSQKAAVARYIK